MFEGTGDSQLPWAAMEFGTRAPAYAGGHWGSAHHTGPAPWLPAQDKPNGSSSPMRAPGILSSATHRHLQEGT